MFTRIFDQMKARQFARRAFFAGLVLPLAGCLGEATDGAGELGFLPAAPKRTNVKPPLRKTVLYRGNVVVAGPQGYCLDPDSLRRGVSGSFVLLASCESLTGKLDHEVTPAVMTVSVLPRGGGGAEQPSAAALAASMASAKVIRAIDGDGVSLVQLASGGAQVLPGGDPVYWRAGMVINGHVTGLAVYGAKGGPVSGNEGKRLIMALAKSLRENSPVRDYPPAAKAPAPATTAKPKGLRALFGGLFPNPD